MAGKRKLRSGKRSGLKMPAMKGKHMMPGMPKMKGKMMMGR